MDALKPRQNGNAKQSNSSEVYFAPWKQFWFRPSRTQLEALKLPNNVFLECHWLASSQGYSNAGNGKNVAIFLEKFALGTLFPQQLLNWFIPKRPQSKVSFLSLTVPTKNLFFCSVEQHHENPKENWKCYQYWIILFLNHQRFRENNIVFSFKLPIANFKILAIDLFEKIFILILGSILLWCENSTDW